MTPEELQQIERNIPGFSGMTPEMQENIATRLRLRQSAQQVQQPKQDPISSSLPVVAGIGASKLMGGGSTAGGALTTPSVISATKVPATAAPTSMFGLADIGAAGNMLLPAAGTLGAIDLFSNDRRGARGIIQGGLSGVAIGSGFGGAPGAVVGGAIGTAAGIAKTLEGGKSKDQQGRDKSRGTLQQAGLYDKDFNLTLSDGTKVNMGLDGSVKNYNVDFSKQGIGDVVALVNPLAFLVAQGDQKRANDLAGELTNAIYGSKDPRAEAKKLYEQLGVTIEQANEAIDKLSVDDETKNVFKGTLSSMGLQSGKQQSGQSIYPAFGKITGFKMPKAQPVDNRPAMRSALLQSVLADTQTPLQYNSKEPQQPNKNLNATMARIAGL